MYPFSACGYPIVIDSPVPIVIIDDDRADFELARLLLRNEGVTNPIIWCPSAEIALSVLVHSEVFSIVLLDATMPGMSGQEFFDTLVSRHPDVRARSLIFVYSNLDAERIRHAFAGRAVDGIVRKASAEDFIKKLSATLLKQAQNVDAYEHESLKELLQHIRQHLVDAK